jgi:hypothetical protein
MSKQDFFTRDTGNVIAHKKVGSEIRETLKSKFNKALKAAKK